MESSRTQINLVAGGFTNLYTAASITVGMKLGLQNLSSDPIIITLGTSGSVNKGYILNPLESTVIPAGVTGCFVQTVTGEAGIVAIDIGGYNVRGFGVDERVYTGYKALCVQSFTESNSKNGTQFTLSARNAAVAVGSSLDMVITTGAQPVLIKAIQIQYTGNQIETAMYKGSVVSGGSSVTIYNMNTDLLTPCLATVKNNNTALTITSLGTQVTPTNYAYGVPDQGNKVTPSFITSGLERVLAPNTTYLRRIFNRGTATCIIDFDTSFYEGELSSSNG